MSALWTEVLPIGSGYQGAMLFGGVDTERLQADEGTAWSGGPAGERMPPIVTAEQARAALDDARTALRLLDLSTATHEAFWKRDGAEVRQSAFAGHPGRVLVHRLRTQRPVDVVPPHDDADEPIVRDAPPGAALRGAACLAFTHDGVTAPRRHRCTTVTLANVTTVDMTIVTATTLDRIGSPRARRRT